LGQNYTNTPLSAFPFILWGIRFPRLAEVGRKMISVPAAVRAPVFEGGWPHHKKAQLAGTIDCRPHCIPDGARHV